MSVIDTFRLDGKVAIVTGSARGLGQSIAIGLADAGADVFLVDTLAGEETAAAIRQLGRQAAICQYDLLGLASDRAEQLIAQCNSSLGGVDILVNNAGIIRRDTAVDFSERDWREVLSINLDAAFYLSQAAARHFVAKQRPGKIINMASMLSFQGGVTVVSYAAAKSAIAGMTRALANEWAADKIFVNALAPGYFATELTRGIRSDPVREAELLQRIPAGRWGVPEDLQGPVVFLASAASNYLNGTILAVDGGWLSR
ncbi:MAG: SDR family oxidoreductase [Planctomycetales bacterium]|nr:SDR family oxidoreductase [Planctomycetales bacterium]